MAKIGVKGTIVADDDKWIYEYFGIAATCPKDIQAAIMEANGEDLDVGDQFRRRRCGGRGMRFTRHFGCTGGKVNIIISGMAASAASYIGNRQDIARFPRLEFL